VCVLVRSR